MKIIINRQNILQAIERSKMVGQRDCGGCYIHHLVAMFHIDMYRPCSYIKKLLNEQHYTHFEDTDGCKYSWISPDTVKLDRAKLSRVLKI